MNTLIKWPGGKSTEFEYIKDIIPQHERYIEPFFGGGAVFFKLKPKKAIINDICEELICFYRLIKGGKDKKNFKKELIEYSENWEKISLYIKVFDDKIIRLYKNFKTNKITKEKLKNEIKLLIESDEKKFNELFNKNFSLDNKNLLRQIVKNIISKLNRVKKIELQRGKITDSDLKKNIETAFRSGFYMHFRDVMNYSKDRYETSLTKKIANYYFIREFCYASMFRFNGNGHFNIPYGGMAYNSKNFRTKVNYILSDEVSNLFKNTIIENKDFETILKSNKLSNRDFIFLDPPYDTDFSDYEKASFDKKDQERLAKCLFQTKAKYILIIKNTPFILNLYKNKPNVKISSFEKTYLYNVKGRNNREVEHLIIKNF